MATTHAIPFQAARWHQPSSSLVPPEMTDGRTTIVFVSLAMNQAQFFHRLGLTLAARGFEAVHVCFHERSHEHLQSQGVLSFNAFEHGHGAAIDLVEYDIPHLNLLLGHERAAYEIKDSASLLAKLQRHLAAAAEILDAITKRSPGPLLVVQELGGFLSVLAWFYEARRRGVPSIFIEPSFFRGRVFFARDSLTAPAIAGPTGARVTPEVKAYLDDTVRSQSIVVPTKDRLHYRAPWRKLLDSRNVRRLVQKSIDKYVLGKREEFEHVSGHVRRHLRMFVTNRRLRSSYAPLPGDAPFVYYPLHVPADFALTIRSPQFLDQLALLSYLAAAVPHPFRVAVKEHPALVGAVPGGRMRELLRTHDNVVLLNPGLNNYDIMRAATAVVTVNSKSGAEALLIGKPVVVLGDAFYRPCSLVQSVDDLARLPQVLAEVCALSTRPDPEAVQGYFQDVWDASWAGDLYEVSSRNIESFAASLATAVSQQDLPRGRKPLGSRPEDGHEADLQEGRPSACKPVPGNNPATQVLRYTRDADE